MKGVALVAAVQAVAFVVFVPPLHAGTETGLGLSQATETARSVIVARGAPCGQIIDAIKDHMSGNIVAGCSNGMMYGVVRDPFSSKWRLTRRNTLTGKFEPFVL